MNSFDENYLVSLVKRAQNKDSEAFTELYALTYERQYNFARHYLRDPDDAWDAIQEVYILALRKLNTLRDPRRVNAWLTQINSRICYDIQEKRRLASGVSLEVDIADDSADPEQRVMQNVDAEVVSRAIERLPDKERQAIELKYIRQYSLQQIADAMSCSVSSVTRYLERGKKQIEKILRREEV